MYESKDLALTADEELANVLLDFIIVAATLAKKLTYSAKLKSINEGGKVNEQSRQLGYGHQRPANRGFGN